MGLRSLAYWDCKFESRRWYECLSLFSVLCVCQVEVSATGRSLFQRSPTLCGVSKGDLESSTMRRPTPTRAVEPRKKEFNALTSLKCTNTCQRFTPLYFVFQWSLPYEISFFLILLYAVFHKITLKSGNFSIVYIAWLSFFSFRRLIGSLALQTQSIEIHPSLLKHNSQTHCTTE